MSRLSAPNRPAGDFDDVVGLAQHRAATSPDLPVYTFLGFGGTPTQTLTCLQLHRRACAIGEMIAPLADPGDRVLLLFSPGLDYIAAFFACLYAGVIAVPAYPIEPAQPERTIPRLRALIDDAAPRLILGTGEERERTRQALSNVDGTPMPELPWLAVDELSAQRTAWPSRPVDHARPAYLQYTSGSTGTPKGVMLSHRNLMHNSALIAERFGHHADSRGVIWLPPYHDMGLIGGILQPLYAGFPVSLMSHIDFLTHPLRWLRAVSECQATTSGGPNFAYQMLASLRLAEADLERLDLSSWRLAFVGAEPVRAQTLQAFAQRFARCGFTADAFYPCYGLAEHTLFMAGAGYPPQASAATDSRLVSCGVAAQDSRLLVVDPQTLRACADGEVGELWAQGPSVALGYWGRPGLSRQTFEAAFDGAEGRFLRSGDYGWMRGPEVFITGRLKDMLIVRGVNHYAQDLESTVEAVDPEVFRPGGCAVFALESNDSVNPRVVIVRELRARFLRDFRSDTADLAAENSRPEHFSRLRHAVGLRHGLAVHDIIFTPPSSVPKTASGKVQRHACRDLLLSGDLPVVAQWRAHHVGNSIEEDDR